MNSGRDNTKAVAIGVVAVIVLVVAFYFLHKPSYNWYDHSYQDTDEEPYNIDLSKAYLKTLRAEGDFHVLDSTLAINLSPLMGMKDQNYLLFGYMPYIDSSSTEALLAFAKNGNSVFIFGEVFPTEFLSELHNNECVFYENTLDARGDIPFKIEIEEVDLRMKDPLLHEGDPHHFAHYVKDEKKPFTWYYLNEEYFCEANRSFQELGSMNGHVNYVRIAMGEGYIYLHTTPKALSNFYLLRPEGKTYADKVMAYLSPGDIYWDSKEWKGDLQAKSTRYGNRYSHDDGPLSYLLSQESFRWALGLLFISAMLFLVLGTRRKQRAIPILQAKENSSLNYVETLTGLYYAERADGRILRFLSDQFLFFVRERYRIHVKWEEEGYWDVLAKASGVPLSHLKAIKEVKAKGSYEPNVNGSILADFYQKLELFYSECK
jgi:hypothetical protein